MYDIFDSNNYNFQVHTFCVETPRKGFHIYFKYDEKFALPRTYKKYNDIQSDGQCVMFINSYFPNGIYNPKTNTIKPYPTEPYELLNNAPIDYAPLFLIELLTNVSPIPKQITSTTEFKEQPIILKKSYFTDSLNKEEKIEFISDLIKILPSMYIESYNNWISFLIC